MNNEILYRSKLVHTSNDELTYSFENLGDQYLSLVQKFQKLENILKILPLTDNTHVTENVNGIIEAIKFTKKYLLQTQKRISINMSLDLQRFSKSWKILKKTTQSFYGTSVKDKLKKIGQKNLTGQDKADKENSIKENMTHTLFELNDIMEDFVHSLVYYHAMSLEKWSNVYQNFKKTPKKNQN